MKLVIISLVLFDSSIIKEVQDGANICYLQSFQSDKALPLILRDEKSGIKYSNPVHNESSFQPPLAKPKARPAPV